MGLVLQVLSLIALLNAVICSAVVLRPDAATATLEEVVYMNDARARAPHAPFPIRTPRRGHKRGAPLPKELVGRRAAVAATTANVQLTTVLPTGMAVYSGPSSADMSFLVEPPDQALCVGKGIAISSVNAVTRVYNATTGQLLAGPWSNSAMFTGGRDNSDPKCIYDKALGTFFYVIVAFAPYSVQVWTTKSPVGGTWCRFQVGGDFGLKELPDYPTLGMDANGLFITTQQFQGDTEKGAAIFGFNKQRLTTCQATAGGFVFRAPKVNEAGTLYPLSIIQAAVLQDGSTASAANGGTMYFMGSASSNYQGVIVGALWNTSTLNTATSTWAYLKLLYVDGGANTAVAPNPWRLSNGVYVDPSDTRMGNVAFAAGQMYGAFCAGVSVGGVAVNGIFYFIVRPSLSAGVLSAVIVKKGYVASPTNSLVLPYFAIGPDGRGVMGCAYGGPSAPPSMAFATVNATGGVGSRLYVYKTGTNYLCSGSKATAPCRWGDYGDAVYDTLTDSFYLASEVATSATAESIWKSFWARIPASSLYPKAPPPATTAKPPPPRTTPKPPPPATPGRVDTWPVSKTVTINEFTVDPPGEDYAEFIELYNAAAVSVNITGFVVELYGATDNKYNSFKFPNYVLGSKKYVVICSQTYKTALNTQSARAACLFTWKSNSTCLNQALGACNLISNTYPGSIVLRTPALAILDAVSYHHSATGIGSPRYTEGKRSDYAFVSDPTTGDTTAGRSPDGVDTNNNYNDFYLFTVPTPGVANPLV